MEFKLTSEYQPTGDQPEAIRQLVEGVNNGEHYQTLLGVTGSGKTFTIANVVQQTQKPMLVLSHNKTLAAQLYGRTTLILDDRLLTQAKKRAADRKTTVSEVVNEALRDSFTRPDPPSRPFRLITYGDPSKPQHLTPADMYAILEEQDLEGLR